MTLKKDASVPPAGGGPWWTRTRGKPRFDVAAGKKVIESIIDEANVLGLITEMDPADQAQTQGQRLQYSAEVADTFIAQAKDDPSEVPAGTDVGEIEDLQEQAKTARALQKAHLDAATRAGNTALVIEQMVADKVNPAIDEMEAKAESQRKSGQVDPALLRILGPIEEAVAREQAKKGKTSDNKAAGEAKAQAKIDALTQENAALKQESAYYRNLATPRDGQAAPPPADPGTSPPAPKTTVGPGLQGGTPTTRRNTKR